DIVQVADDGTFCITTPALAERFGPARMPGAALEQKHFDIARSLQHVLEESVLELAAWLARETGARHLVMAGGVALNCVLNGRLRDAGIFEDVWVQPAAGDAGTALGAALWIDWQHRGRRDYVMNDVYLGPEFSDDEIGAFLQRGKLKARRTRHIADET